MDSQTIRVRTIPGELWSFDVFSRSGSSTYRVEMSANHGRGACTCIHFEKKCGPALFRKAEDVLAEARTIGEPIDEKEAYRIAWLPYRKGVAGITECAHIAACRNWIHSRRLADLMAAWKDGPPEDWRPSLRQFFER